MRKLIVCNIMSLDGYYTGPGDNIMVMPMDHAFDAYNAERLRAADTLLLGRVSFEGLQGYWPGVKDDPAADETNREISRLNGAIDKVVISDTLTDAETDPWRNTTIVPRSDAAERIADLKARDGKEILVFGSQRMWSGLLAGGLVDELHLMLGHTVAGDGRPIFAARPDGAFRLLETRTWDDSSNVLVRYAVERTAP